MNIPAGQEPLPYDDGDWPDDVYCDLAERVLGSNARTNDVARLAWALSDTVETFEQTKQLEDGDRWK